MAVIIPDNPSLTQCQYVQRHQQYGFRKSQRNEKYYTRLLSPVRLNINLFMRAERLHHAQKNRVVSERSSWIWISYPGIKMAFHWFVDFHQIFCISLFGNYGVTIIILTILIKLIFWPLGNISYKSMKEIAEDSAENNCTERKIQRWSSQAGTGNNGAL